MPKSVTEVRTDMPFLKDLVYLDSASVVPCPSPVLKAMDDYLYEHPFNYGVGVFTRSVRAAERVDEARRIIAKAIGARSEKEVVFTKNTTEAINTVAHGLAWRPGDEIVLTTLEHQSNVIPWMMAAREHGARVKFVRADASGLVDPEDIRRAIGPSTRLVACTHVSNVFGTIQPVKEATRIARDKGVLSLVDAAQSAGRIPVRVDDIGCDFVTFCGRKALMGPQGTGFLWGRLELLRGLEPLTTGSRAANVKNEDTFELSEPPYKFEAGVLNTPGVIGLGKAVLYIEEIGYDDIIGHIRQLTQQMLNILHGVPGVVVHGSDALEYQAGIVSWNVSGMDPHDVARGLDRIANVAVASGAQGSLLGIRAHAVDSVVRTSVHYYNTPEDIETFGQALRELLAR
ncbi:MAG TPA: cysteine desulfurase [Firmicutes bacterium]|nr:cysteine desulfurase [Bacillota bacterium]